MSTQVARTSVIEHPLTRESVEGKGEPDDSGQETQNEAAKAFAEVAISNGAAAPGAGELDIAGVWKLISLCLPRGGRSADGMPGIALPDIVVPDEIARDSRRRIAFRIGAWSARELGLDAAGISAAHLIALGQQTLADHIMSDAPDSVLVAVARAEGKVDEAAWASGDKEKIAAQVSEFLQSEFKDEFDLYGALEGLAAEPPLLGRKELADQLLRRHGIDPDVLMRSSIDYLRSGAAASSPSLVPIWTAGKHYFNRDRLTADAIREMRIRGGGTPTDAHIDRMLRELPDSLDVEFTKRFDAHKQRMSTLLATWLSARLSLHAGQAGIDLKNARVTISRAKMRMFMPVPSTRQSNYSDVYGTRPSSGLLVSFETGGNTHRCFVSSRTGEVHVLPPGETAESWFKKTHELVFEDAAARAELDKQSPAHWRSRVFVETAASGPQGSMREWLTGMFSEEMEQGRETARGETVTEGLVDALLNLIPFRQMVVALRKGDIPTAVVAGGLDVLFLIPLVGTGVRLSGAAIRSATPWLSMGMRFGGAAGRQGLNGMRRLVGQAPLLRDRIRSSLTGSAIRQWGRLRPLDVQRVAQALRATAPRLASMLDDVAARARGATVPDGVWRVHGGTVATATGTSTATTAAAAEVGEGIGRIPTVTAHSLQGNTLALVPYGERAGVYTQADAAGRRIGALLVADSGGWLHQTLPVASLERYRVGSLDIARVLDGTRIEANGTVALNGAHYARIGADYVQVIPDHAVSTASRPLWRVVAPQDVTADVVAHRLAYDAEEGLWRQAEAPGLAGGGNGSARPRPANRIKVTPTPGVGLRLAPSAAQLARFQDALMAGMRGATPERREALLSLLARVRGDRRGQAILRAMSAHYQVLGQAPEIVLRDGSGAPTVPPSLDAPVPGNVWHLDLEALRHATIEAVVSEFAATYNNMTGLLQNHDPFEALLAQGQPVLDPRLENNWSKWLQADPDRSPPKGAAAGKQVDIVTSRDLAIEYLRKQLREMYCYGGLDKSTFKSLLRNQPGKWTIRINLSHRNLNSVPPLPRDTEVLLISNNPIKDWDNLPGGLTGLTAAQTDMSALPDLPAGLRDLDVRNNSLGGSRVRLPKGLVTLDIGSNGLYDFPTLPGSLKELVIDWNFIGEIPNSLPNGLEQLDVSHNVVISVPVRLPPGLQVLRIVDNALTALPDLSLIGLQELYVTSNRMEFLPALPATLRILEAGNNALVLLPPNLPRRLEIIIVPGNELTDLPDDLPVGLRFLAVQCNAIARLPGNIAALEWCTIQVAENPLDVASIPPLPAGRNGPMIVLSGSGAGAGRPPKRVPTLAQAVRHWWTQPSDAQARWEIIDKSVGMQSDVQEFALFLNRLRVSASYKNGDFRAQVEDWLVEISKPERKALLEETLNICRSSTQTCEDRLVTVWNEMQALRINDDIRWGVYDTRVADAVDLARQMFRINVLAGIAWRKTHMLAVYDEVEVYLAYVIRLRNALGLTTPAPRMRYYPLSQVTSEDLAEAREIVTAREREEFDKFLVLDYEPWQTLLKRKDAKAYAHAEAAAHRALETRFEPEMQKELAKLRLDPNDAAVIEDARKDLGPRIMREIRYRVFEPLTRELLAGIDKP